MHVQQYNKACMCSRFICLRMFLQSPGSVQCLFLSVPLKSHCVFDNHKRTFVYVIARGMYLARSSSIQAQTDSSPCRILARLTSRSSLSVRLGYDKSGATPYWIVLDVAVRLEHDRAGNSTGKDRTVQNRIRRQDRTRQGTGQCTGQGIAEGGQGCADPA